MKREIKRVDVIVLNLPSGVRMNNVTKERQGYDAWVLGGYEIFRDEYETCLTTVMAPLRVDNMN